MSPVRCHSTRPVLLFFLPVFVICGCQRHWDNPYGETGYNTAPTAVFTVTRSSETSDAVFTFDASGCTDREDDADGLKVRWDWESDGTWDTDWKTAKTDTHTFAAAIFRQVTMEAKDGGDLTDVCVRKVGISFSATTRLDAFTGIADVDASAMITADSQTVAWDWDGNGSWDTGFTGLTTASHTYPLEGSYTIRVRIQDTDGTYSVAARSITLDFHPGMKKLHGGVFTMGQADPDIGSADRTADEQPVRSVTVSPFWMDSVEVTQADYTALMNDNPAFFAGTPDYPMENVTWYQAVLYCNARSRRDGLDTVYSYSGRCNGCGAQDSDTLSGIAIDYSVTGYRLPTEAEWEYACRAGGNDRYSYGGSEAALPGYGWYYTNSGSKVHAVAGKSVNIFGLYDMHGNVWEWCNDWFGTYDSLDTADPTGPDSGRYKVIRGGGYESQAENLRCAERSKWFVPEVDNRTGFRVVLPAD